MEDKLPLLPNGKPHVSFSEVKAWRECPWRHKLIYIDNIGENLSSPHLDYGTILHNTIENFLKTKKMNIDSCLEQIKKQWDLNGFDSEEYIQKETLRAEEQGWKYTHMPLAEWLQSATNCLEQLPVFMDKTFGKWKTIEAEHYLYEDIEGVEIGKFKGFIDAVILSEVNEKKKVWIIDWKTSGPRGWSREKQQDYLTQSQVILYKSFWGKKLQLKSSDIACGFILLKKQTKKEKAIQMIKVSAGPKAMEKSQKIVRSSVKGMQSGLLLKNREACKFCEFKNTEYCK